MPLLRQIYLRYLALRTPLTANLGWATILKRTNPVEATLANALEVIERNARAQAQIVNDILDVSRIITGKLCAVCI